MTDDLRKEEQREAEEQAGMAVAMKVTCNEVDWLISVDVYSIVNNLGKMDFWSVNRIAAAVRLPPAVVSFIISEHIRRNEKGIVSHLIH